MNIARSLQQWRQSRRTFNELSRLSARELDDLGITRADIPRVSRQASRS